MNSKAKRSRYRPGMAQRVGRGIALRFHDRGTRRGEWSAARPGRTLPPAKIRYPFYRRLGGPQGRSGRAKNLVPTGIRSRTVQPVAQSLYRLRYPAHRINNTGKEIQIFNNNPQRNRLRGRPNNMGWNCVQTHINRCKIKNWKESSKHR